MPTGTYSTLPSARLEVLIIAEMERPRSGLEVRATLRITGFLTCDKTLTIIPLGIRRRIPCGAYTYNTSFHLLWPLCME